MWIMWAFFKIPRSCTNLILQLVLNEIVGFPADDLNYSSTNRPWTSLVHGAAELVEWPRSLKKHVSHIYSFIYSFIYVSIYPYLSIFIHIRPISHPVHCAMISDHHFSSAAKWPWWPTRSHDDARGRRQHEFPQLAKKWENIRVELSAITSHY